MRSFVLWLPPRQAARLRLPSGEEFWVPRISEPGFWTFCRQQRWPTPPLPLLSGEGFETLSAFGLVELEDALAVAVDVGDDCCKDEEEDAAEPDAAVDGGHV